VEIKINAKTMKGNSVMKTFIVYNLDTRLPVAVGEAIKAEWARLETADKTKIRAENLIAEEISLPKMLELPEKCSSEGK
jgi:hypothetical protein